MTAKPNVAIIGAGPAGCTLARLLLNASIPVTIFEGEVSRDVRSQGGTLDLHTNTGQKALKEAELWEQFLKYARFDGEAMAVFDKNLKPYIKIGGTSGEKSTRGRPEIDRASLRQILLDSLPEGMIRWGSRLRSIDQKDHTLRFDHGEEKGFDLIVGADGAWSKVRPLVSTEQPFFAGLGGVDLIIENAAKNHPGLNQLVNRGSVFAVSDGKTMVIQQIGGDCLNVYAWARQDENWMKTCGFDIHDPSEVKAALLKQFSDWDQMYRDMIQAATDDHVICRSMYILPIGHKWESKEGVTLIGDAAHLMSPFAGEGVNLAMEDAMKLAHAIIDASRSAYDSEKLYLSIQKFEAEMNSRATPMANVSQKNMVDMMFTPGAPRTTVASWVRRAITDDSWIGNYLLPVWFVRFLLRWIFWW